MLRSLRPCGALTHRVQSPTHTLPVAPPKTPALGAGACYGSYMKSADQQSCVKSDHGLGQVYTKWLPPTPCGMRTRVLDSMPKKWPREGVRVVDPTWLFLSHYTELSHLVAHVPSWVPSL